MLGRRMTEPSALPLGVAFPDEPAGVACPACGAGETRVFYSVDAIPVHSCVLCPTRQAARAFARGDMRLASCGSCGLVFNAAFEPERVDYSSDYEETQGFSATFTTWLEELARRLIEEHDLRGRTVLEIGCGRGDFLELVCRVGGCRGIGVDPSETAGRVDRSAGGGLTFLRERYSERHAALAPDAVFCRHTLEHLSDARGFVRLLRRNLEGRDGLVFIEVPDVLRELAEGAFWDIYYEHALYFAASPLAALLRSEGFEVEDLRRAYGEQYLQVTARPAARVGEAGAAPADRDALSELASAVSGFRGACRAALARWHAFLEESLRAGESVVLWGSGSKATGFLSTLGLEVPREGESGVRHVVDVNPSKHGRFVAGTGQEIVSPESLRDLRPDHVVIMNPVYEREIAADLGRMGLVPRLHVL